jgi:hypothetical protein
MDFANHSYLCSPLKVGIFETISRNTLAFGSALKVGIIQIYFAKHSYLCSPLKVGILEAIPRNTLAFGSALKGGISEYISRNIFTFAPLSKEAYPNKFREPFLPLLPSQSRHTRILQRPESA